MTMATEIKSRMSSVQSAGKPTQDVNLNTRGKPVQSSSGCC